jgi:hypothetical protein
MSSLSRVVYSPDTTPPTTPASVTASSLSQTAIRISWAASTDTGGSGLAGYRVYRSTTSTGTYSQIGSDLTTASLSYDDTGLTAGSTRFYRIVAFDGNSNASSQSSTASATTTSASTWADVTVGMAGLGAQLATPGRKVRLDLTGSDYGLRVDTVNGASSSQNLTGAFDGSAYIELRPQTAAVNNANNTYVGVANGANLWNSGSTDVAQSNAGFCMYWGSRYIDLAATAKITGFVGAASLGGETSASASRAGMFEATHNGIRVISITSRTFASYTQPNAGFFPDDGPDEDHLMHVGTAINHANNPPLVGQEWLYFEHEADYRQNRGNANGRNRVDVWARDGYLGYLEVPLNYGTTWDYSYQYIAFYEYIGGLFNNPSTANANNFFRISHVIFSNNRSVNDRIGPPPGFLT